MDRSAYAILVIVFSVFLATVIVSNLLAMLVAFIIKFSTKRKVAKS